MINTVTISQKLGYLEASQAQMLDIRNLSKNPKRRTVILTTGSQGEPMSALSRIATGQHKQIKIKEGDTVILSSKFIPGNEGTIAALINEMFKQGAQVVYETIREIHTSGHAHKEELKLMLKLIHPKFFIPIHGQMRHLVQHGRLAVDMGVLPENVLIAKDGDVVAFQDELGQITESTATGRVFVDGKGVGDVGNIVLTDRRLLSENGVVTCTIAFDEKSGKILNGPHLHSRGFVYEPEFEELFEELKQYAKESFSELVSSKSFENGDARDQMAKNLRRIINKRIQRRPVVIPVFIRLSI